MFFFPSIAYPLSIGLLSSDLELHLKFSLPKNIVEKKFLYLDQLRIPKLGIFLQGVKISWSKEGSIEITALGGKLDPLKAISLLKEIGLIKELKKVPSFKGPLEIKNIHFKQNLDHNFWIEIEALKLSQWANFLNPQLFNLKISSSSDGITIRGEKLLLGKNTFQNFFLSYKKEIFEGNCSFCSLDLNSDQVFLKQELGLDIYPYIKKFFPYLKIFQLSLGGFLSLSSSKFILDFASNKRKLKYLASSFSAQIDTYDQKQKLLTSFWQGKISGDEKRIVGIIEKLRVNIKKLKLAYNKKEIIFQKVFGQGKIENISLNQGQINLAGKINIPQGKFSVSFPEEEKTFILSSPLALDLSIKGQKYLLAFSLSLKDLEGGSIFSQGKIVWPFDFPQEILSLEIKDFSLSSGKILFLKAKKDQAKPLSLDLISLYQGLKIELNQSNLNYTSKRLSWNITQLKIKSEKENNKSVSSSSPPSSPHDKKQKASLEKRFDFTPLKNLKKWILKSSIKMREFTYDRYSLEDLALMLDLTPDTPQLLVKGNFCYNLFALEGQISFPSSFYIEGDIITLSSPMDQWLACFLSQAPVYIVGQITAKTSISAQGRSFQELIDTFSFNSVIELKKGKILKVSNLNEHLRWLLQVLSLVKLNPSKLKDTIEFDILEGALEGGSKKILLKRIFLSSPLAKMQLNLSGSVILKPKIKKDLQGTISVIGLSKKFRIKDE